MTSGFIIMALQTAFNTKQHSTVNQHKKTIQSIRLFWAHQYNRIIVDDENCKKDPLIMSPAPSAVEMQTCVQQHGNIDTSEQIYL